jgi:hypothetical protein
MDQDGDKIELSRRPACSLRAWRVRPNSAPPNTRGRGSMGYDEAAGYHGTIRTIPEIGSHLSHVLTKLPYL